MLIAQLSDLHIKAGRRKAYGVVDTAAHLEIAIAHLLGQPVQPDAVVLTGDLVDHGSREDYDLLRQLLKPLLDESSTLPCYLLAGNHDDTTELREAFPEHSYLRSNTALSHYTATLGSGSLRLIGLNTTIPHRSSGELSSESLAWLDEQLSTNPTPTLIAMHHPPFATGISHMDEIGLVNSDAFEHVISRHSHVKRIICGHLHRPIEALFGGVIASTCPSTAHQVALDLQPHAADQFIMEPPGYQLHQWNDARFVTHTVVIGNFEGPYRFRNAGVLID
jgi:3',5'-cyclic-AMP phosphodiesterase